MPFDPGTDLNAGAEYADKVAAASRYRAAYNALSQVHGPDAASQVLGSQDYGTILGGDPQAIQIASQQQAQQAQAGYNNALSNKTGAETAQVVPNAESARALQGAQTGQSQALTVETGARTAGQTLGNLETAKKQHAYDFLSELSPDGSNAGDVFDRHADQMATDFGLDSSSLPAFRARIVADPFGVAARALGVNPSQGVAVGANGQPVYTTENPLQGVPQAAQTNVTPLPKFEGAPLLYKGADGKSHAINFANGRAFEGGAEVPTSVLNSWTPVRQQAVNVQVENAETNKERLTGEGAPASATPGKVVPVQGSGDPAAIPPASRYARLITQKDKDTANDAAKQVTTVADGVAQAKPIIQQTLQQITPYTTGAGSLLKDLPGSVQNNLKRNLETLKANEFLSVLGSMKNAKGQSGMGRVLQAEVPMMQAAFGNMSQDQTTTQLAQHLSLLSQLLDRSNEKAVGGFKANYGANPYDVAGVKPYAPKMTTPPTGAAAKTAAAPSNIDNLLAKYAPKAK